VVITTTTIEDLWDKDNNNRMDNSNNKVKVKA